MTTGIATATTRIEAIDEMERRGRMTANDAAVRRCAEMVRQAATACANGAMTRAEYAAVTEALAQAATALGLTWSAETARDLRDTSWAVAVLG